MRNIEKFSKEVDSKYNELKTVYVDFDAGKSDSLLNQSNKKLEMLEEIISKAEIIIRKAAEKYLDKSDDSDKIIQEKSKEIIGKSIALSKISL